MLPSEFQGPALFPLGTTVVKPNVSLAFQSPKSPRISSMLQMDTEPFKPGLNFEESSAFLSHMDSRRRDGLPVMWGDGAGAGSSPRRRLKPLDCGWSCGWRGSPVGGRKV